ncbi:MAG: FAD-dependent oxidoreductase [Bacilli bacterium]|nr:FAD-dependent oxidoreductase [Bacilli bacterium]
MKNISIWKDNIDIKEFRKLENDKSVDVLIIGGGITGISTLYHLKDTNKKIMLVEQNKIGFSTTGNSTGKLNFLQNDLLNKIRNNYNDTVLKDYIKSQIDTIKEEVSLIKKNKIDCDLEKIDSYIYTNKECEIEKLKDLEYFLNEMNIKTYNKKLDIVKYKYLFYVKDTYLINPIKFIYGLTNGLEDLIYENTSIKKIKECDKGYICYTDRFKIKAKCVVVASHYPYFNIPFLFPIKGYLEKSYISASKCSDYKLSLISYSNPFISIRNYKDYLIYLSNSRSIDKSVCDKKNFNELLKKLNDLNLNPDYLWSNIDIMTNDSLPYVGEIKKHMYLATGYNTWGLTNGFLAGSIISSMIDRKKNPYKKLFSPDRIITNQFSMGLLDIKKNINGYIKGFNGDKKCTHMGCGLIYNEVEHTFDCPCHGSRFDINGNVIMSPANKKI